MPTKAIPDGYHTVTPYLVMRDAARAIDFYKRALGATETFRFSAPDGKTRARCEWLWHRPPGAGGAHGQHRQEGCRRN